jgi:hypothetical protein
MMNTKFKTLWLLPLLTGVSVSNATTIGVTRFTQIAGASFYDAPPNNVLASPTIGAITVTPHPTLLNTDFFAANAPQYGPDVPGSGDGFGSSSTGFGGAVPLILDFSQPVAAFGATFVHFQNVASDPSFTFPVSLQVFSGQDGTGALLGTIIDTAGGVTLGGPAFADFRGLWSSSLNISSAEIVGTSPPNGGFLVDGYAVSVFPVSEPSVEVPTLLGLIAFAILRRYCPRVRRDHHLKAADP